MSHDRATYSCLEKLFDSNAAKFSRCHTFSCEKALKYTVCSRIIVILSGGIIVTCSRYVFHPYWYTYKKWMALQVEARKRESTKIDSVTMEPENINNAIKLSTIFQYSDKTFLVINFLLFFY